MTEHHNQTPLDPAEERLRRAIAALPRESEPAVDLFPAIRERIEAARVIPLDGSATAHAMPPADADIASVPRRPSRVPLIAAAVLCVVAGSALLIGTRSRTASVADVRVASPDETVRREATTADARAAAVSIAADYQSASDDLERVLRARLDRLPPASAQAIRRSLAALDQALAEMRAALAQDPASQELIGLLDSVYRQKLTLLRRANALPLRTT